jgi:hypothetical protein
MGYVLTIEVSNEGQGQGQIGAVTPPVPSRTVIEFSLPAGGTEADAKVIARGIRKAYRDAFSSRVKVVAFQQTGLTLDVDLPAS